MKDQVANQNQLAIHARVRIQNQMAHPKFLAALLDDQLHKSVQNLFLRERRVQYEILVHISEVQRRKLFLKRAFPSLFEYLVKGIGYSPAAAQRRIDGARLLMEVPDVGTQLTQGKISLSQMSHFQKACRNLKKAKGKLLKSEEKQKILRGLEGLTPHESEVFLAKTFDLPIQKKDKIQYQKDESVVIQLTLSADQMKRLQLAKESLSHTNPDGGFSEVIMELAERYLQHKWGKKNSRQLQNQEPLSFSHHNIKEKTSESDQRPIDGLEGAAVGLDRTTRSSDKALDDLKRTLSSRVKKEILLRDRHCQFRDSKTGRICGSQFQLQVDHIHPRWAGGSNLPSNLRALCGQHNRWRYNNGS